MRDDEVNFDAAERLHALSDVGIDPLRIAVVGCRQYDNYDFFSERFVHYVNELKELYPGRPFEFYSGGAPGIDSMIEDYCADHGYTFTAIDADWDKHGKAAGFIRNQQLAERVGVVLVFWDGQSTGTKDMRDRCFELRRRVRTVRIETTPKRYYSRRLKAGFKERGSHDRLRSA
jgi:hypothetical protein